MPQPQPNPAPTDPPADHADKRLTLVKRQHRWTFRYRPGEERRVVQSLADAARNPEVDFDWFDAAVLSHQMGHRLDARLKRLKDK